MRQFDDNDILNNGYKEYRKSPLDSDGIEKNFSKWFRDGKRRKYAIDIHKWKPLTHPHTGETFGPNYEFSVYFKKIETEEPVTMNFFAGWDIETVEDYVEKLFQTGLFDCYDTE